MAKLTGVKTLDMVNGEITKVAYNGAEYERVEGDAQEGDLVLITDGSWCDATKGEFYLSVGISAKDPRIVDDIDEVDSNYEESYALFRKVSASQPTLEDRVSTNEKDIESLKSDVAALKGEAETEYVRIDKSEAKAGDFVKFDEAPFEYLTAGKFYEIEFVDDFGDPFIYDDEGDSFDTHVGVFEVYRKVSAAEPKPERLKVGDYAKVVEDQTTSDDDPLSIDECVGDYVEVLVDDKLSVPFKVRFITGKHVGDTAWAREFALVRATDEEVAEAKDAAARAKFKKGDKVRLKSGGGEYPLHGFKDGGIYSVYAKKSDREDGKNIVLGFLNGYGCGYATPDQLELLSEEDAAEIEKWDAIGREVSEYKVGDIVSYLDGHWFRNRGVGEVVNLDYGARPVVEGIDCEGKRHRYILKPDKLELITTVEARFDRKDDE